MTTLPSNDVTAMIDFLNERVPLLLPRRLTAWLAGSILEPEQFREGSDVDVFLRGPGVDFFDLTGFFDLTVEFGRKFGRMLHVYPTDSFRGVPQEQIPVNLEKHMRHVQHMHPDFGRRNP